MHITGVFLEKASEHSRDPETSIESETEQRRSESGAKQMRAPVSSWETSAYSEFRGSHWRSASS